MRLDGNFTQNFLYWTQVQVGSPPRNYTVTVDTGSSDFLIPAKGCWMCAGKHSNFYEPAQSRTYKPVPCTISSECTCVNETSTLSLCQYVVAYTGIAEQCVGAFDLVAFLNQQEEVGSEATGLFGMIQRIRFGATVAEAAPSHRLVYGDLNRRVASRQMPFYPDGMWGMAYEALESIGQPTVLDALHAQTGMPDLFSMQLDAVGGLLVLGGTLEPQQDALYHYAPLVRDDFYRVRVLDVQLGGRSLGLSAAYYADTNCIVDSGTPFPTLPTAAWLALRRLAASTCTGPHPLVGVCVDEHGTPLSANHTLFDGQCFTLSSAQIQQYGSLAMVLAGESESGVQSSDKTVTLELASSQYLLPMYYCEVAGQVGLGITVEEDWTIVGALSMRPYETVFDRGNSRVGFRLR